MDKLKLFVSEKISIILDIGIMYTKVGFAGESSPRKIIPTPSNIFKIEDALKEGVDLNFHIGKLINEGISELQTKLEEFFTELFF